MSEVSGRPVPAGLILNSIVAIGLGASLPQKSNRNSRRLMYESFDEITSWVTFRLNLVPLCLPHQLVLVTVPSNESISPR